MTENSENVRRKAEPAKAAVSTFAVFGFALAILCALAAVLSGPGHRWGWWDFRVGFSILRWAAYVGLGAAGISLVGCIRARPGGPRRGFAWAVLGIVTSLAVVGVLALKEWNYLRIAREVPPIHDITTDTMNPPRFIAILPLRKDAPNPAEYGGAAIAAQQNKGYPDLGPAKFDVPPDQVFERAAAVARAMGWSIVAAVPIEGRIEAVDTTFWFGFKDDVVVRITPVGTGSRVDVRSVSRIGRSDLGTNAKRIRTFLTKLAATVASSAY